MSKVINVGKVRNGVYYNKYSDGWITIGKERYLYYTIKEAIKLWRNKNK